MGKSSGTTTVTNQSSLPPQVAQAYGTLMGQVQNVAQQPLQQYTGNIVAGFTPAQNTAFNTINSVQGIQTPYLNNAAQLTAQGASPITPMAFSPSAVQQYMSPYTQDVVNATQQQFANQNAQQQQQVIGNAVTSGAWGGDRSAVAQALTAGQQQLAEAPTIAGLYNQGYNTGLGEFNTQQQTGVGAQEASGWLGENAGFGMGNLGNEALNTGLTGASAQLQSGALQQQLAQEQLNVPYQQFLQAQAYPFQTTGWAGNLIEGLGGSSGGTSTTTSPAPSTLGQVAGLGLTGLGLVGGTGGFGQNGWLTNLFTGAAHGGRITPPHLRRDTGGAIPTMGIGYSLPNVPDVSISYIPATQQGGHGGRGIPNAPGAPTQNNAGIPGFGALQSTDAFGKNGWLTDVPNTSQQVPQYGDLIPKSAFDTAAAEGSNFTPPFARGGRAGFDGGGPVGIVGYTNKNGIAVPILGERAGFSPLSTSPTSNYANPPLSSAPHQTVPWNIPVLNLSANPASKDNNSASPPVGLPPAGAGGANNVGGPTSVSGFGDFGNPISISISNSGQPGVGDTPTAGAEHGDPNNPIAQVAAALGLIANPLSAALTVPMSIAHMAGLTNDSPPTAVGLLGKAFGLVPNSVTPGQSAIMAGLTNDSPPTAEGLFGNAFGLAPNGVTPGQSANAFGETGVSGIPGGMTAADVAAAQAPNNAAIGVGAPGAGDVPVGMGGIGQAPGGGNSVGGVGGSAGGDPGASGGPSWARGGRIDLGSHGHSGLKMEHASGGAVTPQMAGMGFDMGGTVGSGLETAGLYNAGVPNAIGGNPFAQSYLQSFAQLPQEKLQELSVMLPPSSIQGQLARRALMTKQMAPNAMQQQPMAGFAAAPPPAQAPQPTQAPQVAQGPMAPPASGQMARGGRAGFDGGGVVDPSIANIMAQNLPSSEAPAPSAQSPWWMPHVPQHMFDLSPLPAYSQVPETFPARPTVLTSPAAIMRANNPVAPSDNGVPSADLTASAPTPRTPMILPRPEMNAGASPWENWPQQFTDPNVPTVRVGLGDSGQQQMSWTQAPPTRGVAAPRPGMSGPTQQAGFADQYKTQMPWVQDQNGPPTAPSTDQTANAADEYQNQMPWAQVPEKPGGEEGFMNSPWYPLIAAGLGMMASRNPRVLGQVGEGGLEGLKVAAQQQVAERQEKQQAAAEKYQQGELAVRHESNDVAAKRLQNEIDHWKSQLQLETQKTNDEREVNQAHEGYWKSLADRENSMYLGQAADGSGAVILDRRTGKTTVVPININPKSAPTAAQRNYNWLLGMNVPPDEAMRWATGQSIKPGQFASLVNTVETTDPEVLALDPKDREAAARQRVTERLGASPGMTAPGQTATTPQAATTPTNTPPQFTQAHPWTMDPKMDPKAVTAAFNRLPKDSYYINPKDGKLYQKTTDATQ